MSTVSTLFLLDKLRILHMGGLQVAQSCLEHATYETHEVPHVWTLGGQRGWCSARLEVWAREWDMACMQSCRCLFELRLRVIYWWMWARRPSMPECVFWVSLLLVKGCVSMENILLTPTRWSPWYRWRWRLWSCFSTQNHCIPESMYQIICAENRPFKFRVSCSFQICHLSWMSLTIEWHRDW